MNNIFNQIKRFQGVDITFTPGEQFTFTLPRVTGNNSNVVCPTTTNKQVEEQVKPTGALEMGKTYTIKVKAYMTEPSTSTFDFQDKWNNGIPMPLMIMDGEVIQETRGMYKMKLHGTARPTSVCCCCGRKLTNKISMLYGIGPECGSHFYINPFSSEEELEEHWQELKQKLGNVTWTGWVVKSAIKEFNEVEE